MLAKVFGKGRLQRRGRFQSSRLDYLRSRRLGCFLEGLLQR